MDKNLNITDPFEYQSFFIGNPKRVTGGVSCVKFRKGEIYSPLGIALAGQPSKHQE
jgi:hypothetical protein